MDSIKQILVIEDDKNLATGLEVRLRNAGYDVVLTYDALDGVSQAVHRHPDLVILDINLPIKDGFVVADRIQTLISCPIPIIFLTASKHPALRAKAAEFGAVAYFEKPYEPRELLAAIAQALQSSAAAA